MDVFKTLEDAVVAKLNVITGLKTCATYSGELDNESWKTLTVRFPCIYVYISAADFTGDNMLEWADPVNINLIIGDRNVRGADAARRGDARNLGVYAILQAARDALHNKKIIDRFDLMKMKNARAEVYRPQDKLCVWSANFEIKGVV